MRSETDFEEALSLSRRVGLTSAVATASGINHAELAAAVVEVVIQSLSYAANLHAIQDVEKLDAQLSGNVFSEEELFGQADVFVRVERVAQLSDDAGRIPRSESGVGEGGRVEDRQSLVIVVVIHF